MIKFKNLVVLLVVAAIALAGCATPTPTPTPTPIPRPTATPVPPTPVPTKEPVVLTVAEKEYGLSQLHALPQKHLESDGKAYDGVPLLELLHNAGVPATGTLVLVAADGYQAEVSLAKMDAQSLLAIGAENVLQTVIPGQGKGAWVKNLVKIEYKPEVAAEPVLAVAGKGFTLDELKALPAVKADVDGTAYTGVGLLDLLASAGIGGAEAITLQAADGYKAEVKVAQLTKDCMLAFGKNDALDAVLPGVSKGAWVRAVVAVNEVGGGTAILKVCGQPFSLDQLKALPVVAYDFDGKAYKGVGLLDLLKAAKAEGSTTITLLASDGYSADVAVKDLDDQSILNWVGTDVLDAMIPSQVKGKWVKGTVEIRCK